MSTRSERWRRRLDLLATVAMILASAMLMWALRSSLSTSAARATAPSRLNRSPGPLPPTPVSLDGSHIRGAESATVAVIEFSDFDCPFCQRFQEDTYPLLIREYVD